jgi:hypothetical protein
MKQAILIISSILILTSCISTKRYTSFTKPLFKEKVTDVKSAPENISFDLTELGTINDTIVSTKIASLFIPAIFYWQWDNTIRCDISPQITGQNFKQNFIHFSDSLRLNEKLRGRKLDIKLEKLPNSFIYTHTGTVMIFMVAYYMRELKAVFTKEQDMVVDYKVIENNVIIKEGQLVAVDKAFGMKNHNNSAKKLSKLFMVNFKKNSKNLTREIVEKLIDEL